MPFPIALSISFQFLIGTLKTKNTPGFSSVPARVSIPHRYAKNDEENQAAAEAKVFQFLIGTLKTGRKQLQFFLVIMSVSIPHRYARNSSKCSYVPFFARGFQFLIGTLETCPIRVTFKLPI